MNRIYLLLFVLLFACGDKKSSTTDEELNVTVDSLKRIEEVVRQKIPIHLNFYRQYVGTIGDQAIHLNIIKIGEKLLGNYYRDEEGLPIHLLEGEISEYGDFSFAEFNDTEQVGRLVATNLNGQITGFWWDHQQNKKIALSLQLYTESDQLIFDVFHDTKVSVLVEGDTSSPKHIFIQTLLYPDIDYDGPAKKAVYGLFDELFKGNLIAGNPFATIESMWKDALEQYRVANLEIYQAEPSYGSSMNWSEVAHMEVVYNTANRISIRQNWYNFTGGAHGNTGINYVVMDLEKGERIALDRVIQTSKHKELTVLLHAAIAKQKKLASVDDLPSQGFDITEIKPTENFYLTHKGIGFHFASHQIGGYALGDIDVFLAFKDCREYLSEEFVGKNL